MNFVFDLDGTLSFSGRKVAFEIQSSILELLKNGHNVIFASARPIRDIFPILDDELHNVSMIGGNGSIISANREVIQNSKIESNLFKSILNIYQREKCGILVDDLWNYCYLPVGSDEIGKKIDQNKVALNISLDKIENPIKVVLINTSTVENIVLELRKLGLSVNQYKNENIIDITNLGINKFSGLRALGIEENNYIAFGNDDNDVELFKNSLYSVQIGNHSVLEKYSKTKIDVDENVTFKIINKVIELGVKYK